MPTQNHSPSQQALRTSTASLNYRRDIDGLRAIAILLVVGYHVFPQWIGGGYIGVDIFFVISGFLITGIVFGRLKAGVFSIANFYAKRVRRIFPALSLVVLATFSIGWFILPPREFTSLSTNIVGAALFAQNFVLLGKVGYFDLAASQKPLLHLWSLGIEEQYYVAWPLLLILCVHKSFKAAIFTASLAAASFLFGLLLVKKSPELAFYLPFSRAWELLAGSAISVVQIEGSPLDGSVRAWRDRMERFAPGLMRRSKEVFALVALIAIAYAALRLTKFNPVPGSATLFPVVSTVVLILTEDATVNRLLLSSRPMVAIGLISYPLYLWHYPLLAYAAIITGDNLSPLVLSVIIALSFGMAQLTYQFVEKPIRFCKAYFATILGLCAMMASLCALGMIGVITGGLPARISEPMRSFMSAEEGSEYAFWRRGRCLMLPEQSAENFAKECSGKGLRPLVFIWGDSYGAAFYGGLAMFAAPRRFSISEYTASACPPLLGYSSSARPFCKGINDFVIGKIAEDQPDIVILHSTWNVFLLNRDSAEMELKETVSQLKRLHIRRIVLLGPPTSWAGAGLPANVLDYYYQHGLKLIPERTKYRDLDLQTRAIDVWLGEQAQKLDIVFISLRDVLCDDDGCLARIGENGSVLTSPDTGHLTNAASVFVTRAILDRIIGPQ